MTTIDFDSLVHAYFSKETHKDSATELREWHALRLSILERLFETTLDDTEIDGRTRDERFDRLITLRIATQALTLRCHLHSPFGIRLEGLPGPLEQALQATHRSRIDTALRALDDAYRAVFRDALGNLFSNAVGRSFPTTLLHEKGLSANEPEPLDFI